MFGEVGQHPLQDKGMLFEEFRENISIDQDGGLRH